MDLSNVKSIGGKPIEPMRAKNSTKKMLKLLDDINKNLSKQSISEATAIFNGSGSLCSFDGELVKISASLLSYLCDIYASLNMIVTEKAQRREDFTAANQLMCDVDAIRQHLVAIPFDVIEFHNKHDAHLKQQISRNLPEDDQTVKSLMRQCAVSGHKQWLEYQVSYITEAIRSVSSMYTLVAEKS